MSEYDDKTVCLSKAVYNKRDNSVNISVLLPGEIRVQDIEVSFRTSCGEKSVESEAEALRGKYEYIDDEQIDEAKRWEAKSYYIWRVSRFHGGKLIMSNGEGRVTIYRGGKLERPWWVI